MSRFSGESSTKFIEKVPCGFGNVEFMKTSDPCFTVENGGRSRGPSPNGPGLKTSSFIGF